MCCLVVLGPRATSDAYEVAPVAAAKHGGKASGKSKSFGNAKASGKGKLSYQNDWKSGWEQNKKQRKWH